MHPSEVSCPNYPGSSTNSVNKQGYEIVVSINQTDKPGGTSKTPNQIKKYYSDFFKVAGDTCSIQDILYRRDKSIIDEEAKRYGYRIYLRRGYIGFTSRPVND